MKQKTAKEFKLNEYPCQTKSFVWEGRLENARMVWNQSPLNRRWAARVKLFALNHEALFAIPEAERKKLVN
jgi:hypothetical protein